MKKIIILFILAIFLGLLPIPSFAFNRSMVVDNARTVINPDWVFTNILRNVVVSGPTQIGSSNHTLPAYSVIADNIAQINVLKEQMKSFSVK